MRVNVKLKPAMKIAKTVPNGIFFGHAIAGGAVHTTHMG